MEGLTTTEAPNICGLCLRHGTKLCDWAAAAGDDVIRPTDNACMSYVPLAERLDTLERERKAVKRFLKAWEHGDDSR